ncbi:tRNA pseudouridine synthase 1 [Mucor velutinosus]|uniref:tRNA pseudouridine synthase 1 n=1 Tax=Mucor velutinosus TaxID=708070 RepID=A0AAN7HNV7_9FUNG|nr:tRNA pseudouridine synthase 1 [Mucor velutinosus]
MNIVDFPIQHLIKIVSNLLDSMLNTNNQLPTTQITYFHSRAIPNISVLSYLTRIHKFAPFTNEALLSMLIYFDRMTKLDDGFTINSYNIHRLLITSIVVASKFTSDIFYANSRYAKVGGIPLVELNQLELELLFLLDFQLFIPLEDIQLYADQLLSHSMKTSVELTEPMTPAAAAAAAAATSTTTASSTATKPNHIQQKTADQSIVLPLTPPYTASNEHPPHKRSNSSSHYNPYKRPSTLKKRKLGLVSPKDK